MAKSKKKHEINHDPPVEVSVVQHSMMCTNLTSGSLSVQVTFFIHSEGHGVRRIRQYKYLMLLCKADGSHSVKYALEYLYQLLLVSGTLSQRESEINISEIFQVNTWNRSVNNYGGVGQKNPFGPGS